MRVRETLEKKWRTTGPSFGVRKRCEHLSLFSLMQLNMTHFIDRRTKLGLGEDYIFNFLELEAGLMCWSTGRVVFVE